MGSNKYSYLNKKIKPIIKLNGGRGAILCNSCKKIIKQNISFSDLKNINAVENLFCYDCALDFIEKKFKH